MFVSFFPSLLFIFAQKKDAEEIRQHCDTLNNILLAEFDYFSKTMIDDFELMTARLLKQQADFHGRVRIILMDIAIFVMPWLAYNNIVSYVYYVTMLLFCELLSIVPML